MCAVLASSAEVTAQTNLVRAGAGWFTGLSGRDQCATVLRSVSPDFSPHAHRKSGLHRRRSSVTTTPPC